jgi:hypothetical protein
VITNSYFSFPNDFVSISCFSFILSFGINVVSVRIFPLLCTFHFSQRLRRVAMLYGKKGGLRSFVYFVFFTIRLSHFFLNSILIIKISKSFTGLIEFIRCRAKCVHRFFLRFQKRKLTIPYQITHSAATTTHLWKLRK